MKVKAGLAKAILEEDFAAATVWVVNLHKFKVGGACCRAPIREFMYICVE